MRKDDQITELYYKQLSGKIRNNRDSREIIPSEKKIPRTQNKLKCRGGGENTKTILPL